MAQDTMDAKARNTAAAITGTPAVTEQRARRQSTI